VNADLDEDITKTLRRAHVYRVTRRDEKRPKKKWFLTAVNRSTTELRPRVP